MVFVARTVKEAPDCEPQCGVGRGGISSFLRLLSFSSDGDVIMSSVQPSYAKFVLCTSLENGKVHDALI